jgi:hypothetical protein
LAADNQTGFKNAREHQNGFCLVAEHLGRRGCVVPRIVVALAIALVAALAHIALGV